MIAMAAMAATLTIAAQARANSINFFLTTPESALPPRTCRGNRHNRFANRFARRCLHLHPPGGSGPFTAAQVIFTNPTSANMAPVEINVRGAF
jgi:hypothetical protein